MRYKLEIDIDINYESAEARGKAISEIEDWIFTLPMDLALVNTYKFIEEDLQDD